MQYTCYSKDYISKQQPSNNYIPSRPPMFFVYQERTSMSNILRILPRRSPLRRIKGRAGCFSHFKCSTTANLRPSSVESGAFDPANFETSVAKIIEARPYSWPHDSTFGPKTTALVMIDMQKDFCSPDGYLDHQGYNISSVREIIPRLQKLLQAFRSNNFPIYHTREGHRSDLSSLSTRERLRSRNNASGLGIGDRGPLGRLLIRGEAGHDIIPELYPRVNEPIIDKPGRSAFQHTDFKLLLDIRGIRNLILCGVTTDVCVHSTMREANDHGLDCLLVDDASAASETSLHDFAVESIKAEGGIFGAVTSTHNILKALKV